MKPSSSGYIGRNNGSAAAVPAQRVTCFNSERCQIFYAVNVVKTCYSLNIWEINLTTANIFIIMYYFH